MKRTSLAAVLLILLGAQAALAADEMKAFPPPEAGMARHVLQLPKQDDESALKVELVVGKTVPVDGVNRYFFAGRIEEVPVPGWGYVRYVVRTLGPMGSTLMAGDPDAPKAPRFVPLGGDPYLVRYNSRLPLVLYVPEGAEVRYRVWSAGAEAKAIGKG